MPIDKKMKMSELEAMQQEALRDYQIVTPEMIQLTDYLKKAEAWIEKAESLKNQVVNVKQLQNTLIESRSLPVNFESLYEDLRQRSTDAATLVEKIHQTFIKVNKTRTQVNQQESQTGANASQSAREKKRAQQEQEKRERLKKEQQYKTLLQEAEVLKITNPEIQKLKEHVDDIEKWKCRVMMFLEDLSEQRKRKEVFSQLIRETAIFKYEVELTEDLQRRLEFIEWHEKLQKIFALSFPQQIEEETKEANKDQEMRATADDKDKDGRIRQEEVKREYVVPAVKLSHLQNLMAEGESKGFSDIPLDDIRRVGELCIRATRYQSDLQRVIKDIRDSKSASTKAAADRRQKIDESIVVDLFHDGERLHLEIEEMSELQEVIKETKDIEASCFQAIKHINMLRSSPKKSTSLSKKTDIVSDLEQSKSLDFSNQNAQEEDPQSSLEFLGDILSLRQTISKFGVTNKTLEQFKRLMKPLLVWIRFSRQLIKQYYKHLSIPESALPFNQLSLLEQQDYEESEGEQELDNSNSGKPIESADDVQMQDIAGVEEHKQDDQDDACGEVLSLTGVSDTGKQLDILLGLAEYDLKVLKCTQDYKLLLVLKERVDTWNQSFSTIISAFEEKYASSNLEGESNGLIKQEDQLLILVDAANQRPQVDAKWNSEIIERLEQIESAVLPIEHSKKKRVSSLLRREKWLRRLNDMYQSEKVKKKQMETLSKDSNHQDIQDDLNCKQLSRMLSEQLQLCQNWLDHFTSLEANPESSPSLNPREGNLSNKANDEQGRNHQQYLKGVLSLLELGKKMLKVNLAEYVELKNFHMDVIAWKERTLLLLENGIIPEKRLTCVRLLVQDLETASQVQSQGNLQEEQIDTSTAKKTVAVDKVPDIQMSSKQTIGEAENYDSVRKHIEEAQNSLEMQGPEIEVLKCLVDLCAHWKMMARKVITAKELANLGSSNVKEEPSDRDLNFFAKWRRKLNQMKGIEDESEPATNQEQSLNLLEQSQSHEESKLSQNQGKLKEDRISEEKKFIPLAYRKPIKKFEFFDDVEYCICRRGDDGFGFMIACGCCKEWFHGDCIGISKALGNKISNYYCIGCSRVMFNFDKQHGTISFNKNEEPLFNSKGNEFSKEDFNLEAFTNLKKPSYEQMLDLLNEGELYIPIYLEEVPLLRDINHRIEKWLDLIQPYLAQSPVEDLDIEHFAELEFVNNQQDADTNNEDSAGKEKGVRKNKQLQAQLKMYRAQLLSYFQMDKVTNDILKLYLQSESFPVEIDESEELLQIIRQRRWYIDSMRILLQAGVSSENGRIEIGAPKQNKVQFKKNVKKLISQAQELKVDEDEKLGQMLSLLQQVLQGATSQQPQVPHQGYSQQIYHNNSNESPSPASAVSHQYTQQHYHMAHQQQQHHYVPSQSAQSHMSSHSNSHSRMGSSAKALGNMQQQMRHQEQIQEFYAPHYQEGAYEARDVQMSHYQTQGAASYSDAYSRRRDSSYGISNDQKHFAQYDQYYQPQQEYQDYEQMIGQSAYLDPQASQGVQFSSSSQQKQAPSNVQAEQSQTTFLMKELEFLFRFGYAELSSCLSLVKKYNERTLIANQEEEMIQQTPQERDVDTSMIEELKQQCKEFQEWSAQVQSCLSDQNGSSSYEELEVLMKDCQEKFDRIESMEKRTFSHVWNEYFAWSVRTLEFLNQFKRMEGEQSQSESINQENIERCQGLIKEFESFHKLRSKYDDELKAILSNLKERQNNEESEDKNHLRESHQTNAQVEESKEEQRVQDDVVMIEQNEQAEQKTEKQEDDEIIILEDLIGEAENDHQRIEDQGFQNNL